VKAAFRVENLEEENRQLRAEMERQKQPPATSKNSSQPLSRAKKSNRPTDKPKKKHGPPFSHKRSIRESIDNPDRTISAKVEQCEQCQKNLRGEEPEKIVRRQITELPEYRQLNLAPVSHSQLERL